MKKLFVLLLVLPVLAMGPLTRAEKTNFAETSTYADVMNFLWALRTESDRIHVKYIATSAEGRKIPLVIVSKEGIKTPREAKELGKEIVYIEANIHAGEVEGKEASLMMIRDLVQGKYDDLLENQVILFCPIFNPDGNEKFGKHRYSDNGPQLAGVRYNGMGLDLNRDFVKQETPEVRGLIRALMEWDPVLFVDMHTTDGSYHRHVVTWTPQFAPWTDEELMKYAWNRMFPGINQNMKAEGYDPIPHGGFMDRKKPEKGWLFWAVLARYGVNYVGLRNRFSILDENYARADFKTRVYGAYAFLKSIFRFTAVHGREMREIERRADLRAIKSYAGSFFPTEFGNKKLFEFSLKSYKFEIKKIPRKELSRYPSWFGGYLVKKTDEFKTYKMSYFAPIKPEKGITLPDGYIILPVVKDVVDILLRNGITVERLLKPLEMEVEEFRIDKIEASPLPFQGHHLKKFKGKYVKTRKRIPAGSYFVSLHQPLARLAAVMLEPLSPDGFAAWGLFDRVIVHEWGGRPWMIPVYRVSHRPKTKLLIMK